MNFISYLIKLVTIALFIVLVAEITLKMVFLHKEDGPAQTWYDGGKIYWLNGSEYEDLNITDEEWIRIVKLKALL